jgi:hypothetical protein
MSAEATVLMPLAGDNFYFRKAFDSILAQSFKDFNFYVLSASAENNEVSEIVSRVGNPAIKLIEYPVGTTLAALLNGAIAAIDSKYIVFAGCNDVASPNKLRMLIEYLDQNPDVSACGSAIYLAEEGRNKKFPLESVNIACRMFFSPSMHGYAIAARTELFKSRDLRFRDTFPGLEFYDMLYNVSMQLNFHNLEDVLVYSYEKSPDLKEHFKQVKTSLKSFFVEKLTKFGIRPTEQEIKLQVDLYNLSWVPKISNPLRYKVWLDKVAEANRNNGRYPTGNFNQEIDYQWRQLYKYMFKHSSRRATQYLKADGKTDAGIWWHLLRAYISGR